MDPKITPQSTPEIPKPTTGGEIPQTPELTPAVPAEVAPAAAQAAPVAPVPAMPPPPAPAATVTPTDTPAIADDVDVIEKEWIDKAQDIISKTKTDPYQEEEQIEGLQVDYLKKRYGKDINKPAGGA
jgi:hypothetical protein